MPLYSNILSKREPPTSQQNAQDRPKCPNQVTSASMRFLQDHLASKRRTAQHSKTTPQTISSKPNPSTHATIEDRLHESVEDEDYDPMVPNSYELLLAEYIKAEQRRLATAKRTALATTNNSTGTNKINTSLLEALDQLDSAEVDDAPTTKRPRVAGTAIAPPPSLSSATSCTNVGSTDAPISAPEASTGHHVTDGASVAAKIMSKMGYRPGAGLGRNEQGMSAPLEVEKSGLNVGRILLPQAKPQPILEPLANEAGPTCDTPISTLLRDSTRVILLQNMVGPGEVDDELEAETKEECGKYGEVTRCLIHELPRTRVPDNEAVRIFVEFRHVESAIKALRDLNGRYFGGRVVRASFYSQERFDRYDLEPS